MRKLASLLVLVCLLLTASVPVAAGNGRSIWNVPGDFVTIQEAIDSPQVMPGDTIRVGPGNFYGAIVNKAVHLRGRGQTIIEDGPLLGDFYTTGFWLVAGSDGSSFSQLTLNVDLGIYSRDIDDITVAHCQLNNNYQAITNWGGNRWQIRHNRITDLSNGGAGIVIATRPGRGTEAQHNVVTYNVISGVVTRVDPEDHDISPGIALDLFDQGDPPIINDNLRVTDNKILHNMVHLVSAEPDQKQTAGIAFQDYRGLPGGPPACELMFDNLAAFNDLRGNDHPLLFAPEELADCNYLLNNK